MSELVKTIINLYTNFITNEKRKNRIRIVVIAILLSLFLFISRFFFKVRHIIRVDDIIGSFINGIFSLYSNGLYVVIILSVYFIFLFVIAIALSIMINEIHFYPFINRNSIDMNENFKLDILYKNFKKIFKRFYINIWPFICILYLLTNNIISTKISNEISKGSITSLIEGIRCNSNLIIIILLNSIYALKELSNNKEHSIHYGSDFNDNFTIISESKSLYYGKSYDICFSNKNKIKLYYIFEHTHGMYFTLLRSFYEYNEAKSVFLDMCENIKNKNKEYEQNTPKQQNRLKQRNLKNIPNNH